MKEIWRIDCSKFSDLVTLENGIISDTLPIFRRFQGQPISNLINWINKIKVWGNVDVKRVE